jgi:hypothetical protein
LLTSGKLLIAGGDGSASSELYDVGLGFSAAWQPQLTNAPAYLTPGSRLAVSGSRFLGISQASGGNSSQDSATDYPLVQLRRLDNEQTLFLSVDPAIGWSYRSFTSAPVVGFPAGPALVTVFTNGIPSSSSYLLVTPAAQPLNISTRMEVLSGNNVLIGGFIVTGTEGSTKKVMIRGLGPSLANAGVSNYLADPFLELHDSSGALLVSNDNWQSASNSGDIPNGFQPSDPRESVIVATLTVGPNGFSNFTAILRGANGETGIGLAEAYDLDQSAPNQFANISTRGFVDTGNNVMIGGFILGGGSSPSNVLVRAIGPSLSNQGVDNPLQDPTLELHDSSGTTIKTNDNWKIDDQSGQSQEAAIEGTTIPPSNDFESAILMTLQPGAYTAIVAGKNGTTGVGLVEVYNLKH